MTGLHTVVALAESSADFTAGWLDQGPEAPLSLLGILAVLALIDSTSFGTLLIPVWLLMAPGRLRAGRLLAYLGVVAGAYAIIGLALLAGLTTFGDTLLSWFADARESQGFLLAQAAAAAGLIWYSLRLDPMTKEGKERKREREASRSTADRVSRFRSRAVGEGARGGVVPLLLLALAAVGMEIATLLPYLAGIGLVATAAPELPGSALMILFYCTVMIFPALILLTGRIIAHRLVEGPLVRLEGFLSRHANGTIALILFLLGLLLGLNALQDLHWIGHSAGTLI